MASPFALARTRFARHRLALISLGVLTALALAALLAPALQAGLGLDGETVNLLARSAGPSLAHPLGTDELGRDVLARILDGGRISLGVALTAALFAATIGTAVGLIAGYNGGRIDAVLMRLTDGVIALPLLPLLIVLAAIDPVKAGLPADLAATPLANVGRIVVIVSLFGWTAVARLVRGATLSVRSREYVIAARALGASPTHIIVKHILPNVASPMIVATTLAVGQIILFESALSFLGLGIQPPVPSWGTMLSGALETIWSAPHLTFWPGALIFVTVIAVNFVGDGLQDALDPRALHRELDS